MNLWYFSKDEDPDARPYEPADARSVQPDHYPNVMRPGGGYPEGKGHKTDAFCNSCDDQLVDGSCLRCDWGPTNRSEPIKNFPIDPFEDDKAGIRAASWKFSNSNEELLNHNKPAIVEEFKKEADWQQKRQQEDFKLLDNKKNRPAIVEKFREIYNELGRWSINRGNTSLHPNYVKAVQDIVRKEIKGKTIQKWWKDQEEKAQIQKERGNAKTVKQQEDLKLLDNKKFRPAIVEKFKEIYNELGTWKINRNSGSLHPNYIEAVKEILGQEMSSNAIDIWWKNQEEKAQIQKERGRWQTIRQQEGLKLLDQPKNRKKIINEFRKIYNNLGRWNAGRGSGSFHKNYVDAVEKIVGQKITAGTIKNWWNDENQNAEKLEIMGEKARQIWETLITNEKFESELKKLTEATTANEKHALYGRSTIRKRLMKKFPELEGVSTGSFNRYLAEIVESQKWVRKPAKTSFNEKANAVVYVFQQGSSIKVGIANTMDERIEEYETQRRPSTLEPLKGDGRSKELKFMLPTIQFPEDRRIIPTNPATQKVLKERGLKPIKRTKDKIIRPDRSKSRDRRKRVVERGDIFKRITSEKINVSYQTEEIPGRMAKQIEANILNWWQSLNLSPVLDEANYTETIGADMSKAIVNGMDIGPDLSLELHAFLIQKMVENHGHMENLDATFDPERGGNPEDLQILSNFFDNDPNKINAAFGLSWDAEQGKYVYGNALGEALGISEPQIPSSMWSFEDEQSQKQIDPQTQREQFLTEEQQRILETPQLSPYWRGPERFQEELAKHPEWAETPLPQIPVPQNREQLPQGEWETFEGIRHNEPFISPVENEIRMIDTNGNQWMVYNNQWIRVGKVASYEGWSNWETWNTKLMIDNEYDLYVESRRIVEERRPLEQFAEWATQAVIAPHNQSALADAQEWNEIPYEERPTGREDMPEEARELVEGIFGDDPREDATADILDESKVNWNEIYNSIGEDIKESEARAHEGGEHELPMEQYTGYTSEELIEAKADQHPWCPLCNPENPDAPGDLTIPDDWTGF